MCFVFILIFFYYVCTKERSHFFSLLPQSQSHSCQESSSDRWLMTAMQTLLFISLVFGLAAAFHYATEGYKFIFLHLCSVIFNLWNVVSRFAFVICHIILGLCVVITYKHMLYFDPKSGPRHRRTVLRRRRIYHSRSLNLIIIKRSLVCFFFGWKQQCLRD